MANICFFPEHPVIQHAIIPLNREIIMLINGTTFPFFADPSINVALQLLVLLTIIISTVFFHQQKKKLENENGKKISRFLAGNLVFQIFITIIVVSNSLTDPTSLNSYYSAIPFLLNISLCSFVWVWSFPDHSFKNDLPLAIYIFMAFVLFILNLSFRYIIQVSNFNFSYLLLTLLTFISILFILAGLLVILFKHRNNWWAGILFSLFSIVGLSSFFFNPTPPANLSSLLLFELTAYLFLPFLSGSLPHKIRPEINSVQPINEEMLITWLKVIQTQGKTDIASDFLNAIRLTFYADDAILASSSKMKQSPEIIAMIGDDLKHSHLQKKEVPLSLFESWFKKEKKGFILNKSDSFPAEVDSFLKTAGFEKPISLLFYLIPPSTNSDKQFALLFLSKKSHWNEQHLRCLETGKSELFPVLQNMDVEKRSENGAQNDLLGIKDISSLIHQSKNHTNRLKESDSEKISRLESELKLALEEYDRVLKLLEENMKKSSANWK